MMTSIRFVERKTNLFIRTTQLTDQMVVDKIDTFEQLISIGDLVQTEFFRRGCC
jgi:hypothetical protein